MWGHLSEVEAYVISSFISIKYRIMDVSDYFEAITLLSRYALQFMWVRVVTSVMNIYKYPPYHFLRRWCALSACIRTQAQQKGLIFVWHRLDVTPHMCPLFSRFIVSPVLVPQLCEWDFYSSNQKNVIDSIKAIHIFMIIFMTVVCQSTS